MSEKQLTVVYNDSHPDFVRLTENALGVLGAGVTAVSERDEITRVEQLENLLDQHGIEYRHI